MKNFSNLDRQESKKLMICVVILVISILFFQYLFSVIAPFLLGWLLHIPFDSIVTKLEKGKISRKIGALLVIVLMMMSLGGIVFYLGQLVVEQGALLMKDLPAYIDVLDEGISDFFVWVDEMLAVLPINLTMLTAKLKTDIFSMLLYFVQTIDFSYWLMKIPNAFIGSIITLFATYFFLAEPELDKKIYKIFFAPLFGGLLNHTKENLLESLWGYVKTQFILMVYVFFICLFGLFVLRSPYVLVLSLTISIIDALPMFGSGFILWPAFVICMVQGYIPLGVGYMVLYVVLQVARQLLQPKILGEQIGIHPLLALFSMMFGYEFLGIWGFIIGPIMVILLQTIWTTEESEEIK